MDITVSMKLCCNLFDSSGRLVFDGTLQSPRKAEFSEAFVGVGRLGKANEGAARENIALFIKSLGGSA